MKSTGRLRFGSYTLDPAARLLLRDGEPVELSARYFDALVLLARHPGSLISKDRFFDEVWRGVPVTDEALTQCVRSLRKALGDAATQPQFIETVPKHGYRFVAPVEADDRAPAAQGQVKTGWGADGARSALAMAGGGTLGAGMAGAVVGLAYGFLLSVGASGSGGRLSPVLVMLCVGALAGLVAGMGVAGGIAFARWATPARPLAVIGGGAIGGLVTGGIARLVGMDAFGLLLGHAPRDITGAAEGLVVGMAAGVAAWVTSHASRRRIAYIVAPLAGAVAGAVVMLADGLLLGGSLAALAAAFPGSALGRIEWPPLVHLVAGMVEGAVFVSGVTIGVARTRPAASVREGLA